MESLILSFNAITPIFLIMLLGYIVKTLKLVDKKTFDGINKLIFKVFLPILLFNNIYKTQAQGLFDQKLIVFTIVGVLIIFVIGYFLVFRLTNDNRKRGVMLQGMFRSNFAFLGIPLVNYICGESQTGLASLMTAFVIPIFNVLAVIALEKFRGGNISFKKLLIGIIRNPLIIGCIIGVIFMLAGIKLPNLLEKTVNDISGVATPLAIFVLGASFTFSSLKGYVRDITIITSIRLILLPLIVLSAAAFVFGIHGEALACVLVTFGSPVAVSSFTMAQQMGGDDTLAGHLVVITSVFCLPTLFVWIYLLSSMGLL